MDRPTKRLFNQDMKRRGNFNAGKFVDADGHTSLDKASATGLKDRKISSNINKQNLSYKNKTDKQLGIVRDKKVTTGAVQMPVAIGTSS